VQFVPSGKSCVEVQSEEYYSFLTAPDFMAGLFLSTFSTAFSFVLLEISYIVIVSAILTVCSALLNSSPSNRHVSHARV